MTWNVKLNGNLNECMGYWIDVAKKEHDMIIGLYVYGKYTSNW